MKRVAIVMGSDSDWPIMKAAAECLEMFGVEYEKRVVSAHRTPQDLSEFINYAQAEGIEAIIAGAGGAAHLPGMLASYTYLPVIGIPVKSRALNGIDSLYSIVQMPKGVPVATMAIDNAFNGALFSLRMLANNDEVIRQKLIDFQIDQANESRKKTENLK